MSAETSDRMHDIDGFGFILAACGITKCLQNRCSANYNRNGVSLSILIRTPLSHGRKSNILFVSNNGGALRKPPGQNPVRQGGKVFEMPVLIIRRPTYSLIRYLVGIPSSCLSSLRFIRSSVWSINLPRRVKNAQA
jgi:hypothetical protein